MKHIAASIHHRGLDFVSGNSYVFLAVWNHAGRSAERMKYVPLAERKGDVGVTKRADTKILGTLERHFWPGVILTPERLRDSRMKCLMLRGERNAWVERGAISEEFRVVEDLGDGLVVVER